MRWLLDNVSAVREAQDARRLCFGTVDSWLIYNLAAANTDGGRRHITDVTNASRTMLLDLKTCRWSDDMCA